MTTFEKIDRAKRIAKRFYPLTEFKNPTQKQKDYGVKFAIEDNLYRENYTGKTEILYSLSRDNFVDFGTYQYISVDDLAECKTPADIYKKAVYANWTDKEGHGEPVVPENPNKDLVIPEATAAEIDACINREYQKRIIDADKIAKAPEEKLQSVIEELEEIKKEMSENC